MAGAFVAGEADFTTAFEPTALSMEQAGTGYIVLSVGEGVGSVPYTAYSTTKEYMESNEDVVQKFTNAIYKAQQWIQTASNEEIAEAMQPFFNDLSLDDLVIVVERYIEIDAWCEDPILTEEELNTLMTIMTEAGELDEEADFNSIVNNSFAEEAIK
ncbi:MAG: ABC transporter substrate-binding protein [Peptostreptococcaceae bacterium]